MTHVASRTFSKLDRTAPEVSAEIEWVGLVGVHGAFTVLRSTLPDGGRNRRVPNRRTVVTSSSEDGAEEVIVVSLAHGLAFLRGD